MKIESFTYSDKGSRAENEDSIELFSNPAFTLACIADGVGGAGCGKLASHSSIDFFVSKIKENSQCNLKEVLLNTHANLISLQKIDVKCSKMATTFTACLIKEDILHLVHTGDTRLCVLRGKGIKQITNTHSELNRLIISGKISLEEAKDYPRKHIIESAIGMDGEPMIQHFSTRLNKNDRILLTSDGVHEVISKKEFRDLSISNDSIKMFGQHLVKLLRTKKISDNISFILISIL